MRNFSFSSFADDVADITNITIQGKVKRIALPPCSKDNYRRIILQTDNYHNIIMTLHDDMFIGFAKPPAVGRGDFLKVYGHVEKANLARNPATFDESKWFKSLGIDGKLENVSVLKQKDASLIYRPLQLLDKWRLYNLSLLERCFYFTDTESSEDYLPSSEGVMPALIMGHKSALNSFSKKAMQDSGSFHLLCVSGMHLAFFLFPLETLLNYFDFSFRRKRIILLLLSFYPAILSGFGHGISRACILFLISSYDIKCSRRSELINSLAFAGSLILAFNPHAIKQLSFWMTLTAMTSFRLTFAYGDRPILNNLIASFTVFFIMLPFTLKIQSGANLLSPLLNLILIPLASYLTLSAYLILFFCTIFPFYFSQLRFISSVICKPVIELWLRLVTVIARNRSFYFTSRQFIISTVFVLLFIFTYIFLRKWKRGGILISILIIFLLLFPYLQKKKQKKFTDIIFLDVGQGDATLILTDSMTLLIDGGDQAMGYEVVLPVLRSLGRDHIDVAVVSHAHSDHAMGVLELMTLRRIDNVILPKRSKAIADNNRKVNTQLRTKKADSFSESDCSLKLLQQAKLSETNIIYVMADKKLSFQEFYLDFIAPNTRDLNRSEDLNHSSLVFYLVCNDKTILFTGDMTRETEERLLAEEKLRKSDIYHVSHHGSKQTSSDEFLQAIEANLAVISVGERNLYNHPHPDLIKRLENNQSKIVRTDKSAAFFLRLSDSDSRIVLWQKKEKTKD